MEFPGHSNFFDIFYFIVLVKKFEWLKIYQKNEYLLIEKTTSKIRMIYFTSSKTYYIYMKLQIVYFYHNFQSKIYVRMVPSLRLVNLR